MYDGEPTDAMKNWPRFDEISKVQADDPPPEPEQAEDDEFGDSSLPF